MPDIALQRIDTHFSSDYCYTHARGVATPDGFCCITTQPLRLSGSDIFYGLCELTSQDGGRSWSEIREIPELTRRPYPSQPNWEIALADATPLYHRKTGRILLIGSAMIYCNDEFVPPPRPRFTMWSMRDPASGKWSEGRILNMPIDAGETFFGAAAGCVQYLELPDGDLLVPFYTMNREDSLTPWEKSYSAAVMRCRFDGESLHYLAHGTMLECPVPRGFCEPSIIAFAGRYFLTLRNDEAGYVTCGDDGLHYSDPIEWKFDDGTPLGNYNTQQHWLTINGKLFLAYTRRAENNGHIFRHRAPLFVAEVDPERLCVIRSTEQIAIPERGARLGNFGCVGISDNDSWIIASEWMQSPGELGAENLRRCREHGSDNSIFIAKLHS